MSSLSNGIEMMLKTWAQSGFRNPFESGDESEIEKSINACIHSHSIGAAISALAAGLLPGAGAVVATVISGGVIWKMYFSINSKLGLKLGDATVKTVASAIGANVVQYVIGAILIDVVLSFIPGVNLLATAALGAACYVAVYASAHIYIRLLTNIFKSGKTLDDLTAEEMRSKADEMAKSVNMKEIVEEGKAKFKEAKNSGELKK